MAKDICNTHAYTHTYIYTEKDRPPPQIDMTDATGGGHICSTLKWIERYTVHRRVSTDIIYIRRQEGGIIRWRGWKRLLYTIGYGENFEWVVIAFTVEKVERAKPSAWHTLAQNYKESARN